MGLEIVVNRIKKASDVDISKDNYIPFFDKDESYKKEFPSWIFKYETDYITEEYDWEKYKNIYGVDIHDLILIKSECNELGNFSTYKYINSDNKVVINLDKVPKHSVRDFKVIGLSEIGRYNGGFNELFYVEFTSNKIGYFVWTKKELEEYKEKYINTFDDKKIFQENIIDKFIEGECCVTFDW